MRLNCRKFSRAVVIYTCLVFSVGLVEATENPYATLQPATIAGPAPHTKIPSSYSHPSASSTLPPPISSALPTYSTPTYYPSTGYVQAQVHDDSPFLEPVIKKESTLRRIGKKLLASAKSVCKCTFSAINKTVHKHCCRYQAPPE